MIDLKQVERIVRGSLTSYAADHRCEDAVQEALIRAWKDIEDGMDDFHHVVNRAKVWGRAHLQVIHRRPTGAPRLSRDGVSTEESERKRQKILSFEYEFVKLHNRKPTNPEVAQALGMKVDTVWNQRKNIADGSYDHATYIVEADGRRRISPTYFRPVYLSAPLDDGADNPHERAVEASFEAQLIAEMDFDNLLGKLSPQSAKVVYLHYILGYSLVETYQNLKVTARQLDTLIKKAKLELQEHLDPDFITDSRVFCSSGHEKTEDNIKINSKGHKKCFKCYRAALHRQAEKQRENRQRNKRKPKTHCRNDHEITGLRSNGRRYCKMCAPTYTTGQGPGSSQRQLTDDQVREIRTRYVQINGNTSNKQELAQEFNVQPAVIGNVVNGRRYKHVI